MKDEATPRPVRFKAGQRRKAIEYEKELVRYWQEHKTFEKSVEQRPASNAYVFYDGPPFITGVPHHGTLLSSVIKDAVPRYWTMKGKRVERVWGWDCHGLPAELYTEKKLGIIGKRDIGTTISLEDYIKACRQNMIQTGNEWEDTINRIGRWVDFKGAYKTMDKTYMESVWWAFKKLYDEGKIYEGEKVLLYCTKDATPVSKAEVAMDNSYQEVTDPSVYVKFRLKDRNASLLAWTTTPWTLPANTAVAVGADQAYSEVSLENGEHLILLSDLVEKVLTDEKHQPVTYDLVNPHIKGSELIGLEYEPLFEHRGGRAHHIWDYPSLDVEEGTGIVHLAPAYGEEDYELAKQHGFPVVQNIDDNGLYTEGEWQGQYVWDANKPIAKALHERGVVWKIDYVRHSYPHCWRCGTKLMYRAHPSWFMDIDGQRQQMLQENGNINWFPEHIKHGRFEKTVETAPDWNLSRDRYWATALPVWKGIDNNGQEHVKVVGSYAELKELSGLELEDYHRPWVDDVTFTIDGVTYHRIDKVLDSWFEAGSMPYAQFHYPFENAEKFEQNFPGDFIAEYVAQVRAWFYYLHALSVGLWGKNTFKNVVVTGTVAGNDGRKMSKSYGNYTDPNVLMDEYSADALRFLLLSSPLLNGEDFSLQDKDVQDVQRKLAMVWNMYDFFTTYAEVDSWQWNGRLEDPSEELSNPLDQWIVSRLHQLTAHITRHMDGYDLPNALADVLPFLDDASNWYVRRSRRRFWRASHAHRADQASGQAAYSDDTAGTGSTVSATLLSHGSKSTAPSAAHGEPRSSAQLRVADGQFVGDKDKDDAYRTLHYVLVRLSTLLAPFTPFLAEELFLKLTGGELGESVHLLDWPQAGHIDELVLKDMKVVREIVNAGLAQRAEAGLKVRQPLASISIAAELRNHEVYGEIIAEEVNVKEVRWGASGNLVAIDTVVTPELKREGMMREVIRHVQQARKSAGLQVDDRIVLHLAAEAQELKQAIEEYRKTILQETLATEFSSQSQPQFASAVKIENHQLQLSLQKVS